jgi:hypothetical protein
MCNFQWSKHALKKSTHTVNKNKNMCLTCKFLYIIWLTFKYQMEFCMNRVFHLIKNKCIKVIVTWSLILMDTFSSLNIYWRMHRDWLACFLFKQEALLVFKVHKFTLISQGYFPLLFPIILYMSSSLIFKWQVTCQ